MMMLSVANLSYLLSSHAAAWTSHPVLLLALVAVIVLLVILMVVLNTTKRKRLKEMHHIARLAAESDQLKNAFLANMTHEIRTPLNAIVGFTAMLAENDNLDRETRMVFLKEINENKDALLQLVNDLLDFSKIESDSFEYADAPADINTLIDEACVAENNVDHASGIHAEFVERLPSCMLNIDRARFRQVLSNLLRNAFKFTMQGSIKIGYHRLQNSNFYFYVSDTGCGIDEEGRKAIFDRFVKMNYNIKGTGLGLSISKSIVEHYGGGIGVESKRGEGSTFYFTLPAALEYTKF